MIRVFGWSDALQAAFEPHAAAGFSPARVVAHHRGLWRLVTTSGECAGRLSGRFAAEAAAGEHPVVGDWLAIDRAEADGDALIHALMPRKSAFARRAAGGVGVQVVAANVDIAFLVAGLNNDLNPRRLERYLVAARDSGAEPVVVLTKADLSADVEAERQAVVEIAGGAPVVTLSALTAQGPRSLVAAGRHCGAVGKLRGRQVDIVECAGGRGPHVDRRRTGGRRTRAAHDDA
jgi:ribosome biogenesis GTPase